MTQVNIPQAMTLALRHTRTGNHTQAQAILRQVLAAQPDHPEAIHMLGMIAFGCGQLESATQQILRSIELQPHQAGYYCNLGQVLSAMGKVDQAMEATRKALSITPDMLEANNNLGNLLQARGQMAEAIACYQKVLAKNPNIPQVWMNVGLALHSIGDLSASIEAYRRLLALKPDDTDALRALGQALRAHGRIDEAIETYERAIAIRSDFAEVYGDLGNALGLVGRYEEAIESYRRAIKFRPDYALAHYNLAADLLTLGRFAEGWAEHEWLWRLPELQARQQFQGRPKWNGEELNGRTILLHADQGFGDSIQFARYAPMVAARGGRVILHCQAPLVKLLSNIQPIERIVAPPDFPHEYDVQCPLMSLPGIFGTNLETIPAPVPYIAADPQLSAQWATRVKQVGGLKIGLAWAGRPEYANDRNRSMKLATLAPLMDLPGVTFFSLQKDHPAEPGMNLIDWTGELHDFSDTAALLQNLDLVISVDTAVAHLAGAMGKPVWVLLPFVPDWRWMLDRADSPWYPTMRLYRQSRRGDWTGPVEQIRDALSKWK